MYLNSFVFKTFLIRILDYQGLEKFCLHKTILPFISQKFLKNWPNIFIYIFTHTKRSTGPCYKSWDHHKIISQGFSRYCWDPLITTAQLFQCCTIFAVTILTYSAFPLGLLVRILPTREHLLVLFRGVVTSGIRRRLLLLMLLGVCLLLIGWFHGWGFLWDQDLKDVIKDMKYSAIIDMSLQIIDSLAL